MEAVEEAPSKKPRASNFRDAVSFQDSHSHPRKPPKTAQANLEPEDLAFSSRLEAESPNFDESLNLKA